MSSIRICVINLYMYHIIADLIQPNYKQSVKSGMPLQLLSLWDANFVEHKMFKSLAI